VSEEEVARDRIVKFATVVTLNRFYGAPELSAHISKEVGNGGKRVRLKTQWKSP
jgi:hypothetical protein